jgi:hypothetical protein
MYISSCQTGCNNNNHSYPTNSDSLQKCQKVSDNTVILIVTHEGRLMESAPVSDCVDLVIFSIYSCNQRLVSAHPSRGGVDVGDRVVILPPGLIAEDVLMNDHQHVEML